MIIDLTESKSENTQTPCRATIATRITWQSGQPYETNWIWVKISAFTSNLAIDRCTTLMPGLTIVGIIGATYGTHLTAQMESWRPCDWWDWDKMSDHPAPDHEDIDLNPLTRKYLPVLGGSAWADETWSTSYCSFRALPPALDPHDYFVERQDQLRKEKEEKEKKKASIDPGTPEPQEKEHKRGTSRSKSINRYRNIQYTGMHEKGSDRRTEEQGVAEERGRPRHRS